MRRSDLHMLALIAGLIIVVVAGLLYGLVWRPHSRESASMGVPNKDDLHLYHGVHARGRLKLIAGLGELNYYQRWPALGELLEREKVAPMAPFYSLGYETNVPGNVIRQVPPPGPDTPIVLTLPPQLGFVSDRVAGAQLAAAVEGQQDWAFPSCTLVIRYGSRDTADEVRRVLVERLYTGKARLVIYRGGKGVLAWVVGERPEEKVSLMDWTGLFLVEAPAWKPELLADSDSVNREQFDLVGQNLDGSSVYLYSSVYGGIPYEKDGIIQADEVEALIWRLDTYSHTLQLVCRSESINLATDYLIPSPDGTFLALGSDHFKGLTHNVPTQRPVQVVDCRDGSVYSVTWRDHGNYIHSPIAWSADVPGRLYFIDLSDNLWQLDLDLSQEPPESVAEQG